MRLKLFCSLLCSSLFLIGCSPTEEGTPKPTADRITLSARRLSISAAVVADSVFRFSFTTNKAWSLSFPEQDWLLIDPLSGSAGKNTLNIKLLSLNNSAQAREVLVDFAAGTAKANLTISQDPFFFQAIPSTVMLRSEANQKDTFLLLTTADWTLEAVYPQTDPPVAPWFSYTPSSGSGKGITAVEVVSLGENATHQDRTAQIKATSPDQDPVIITVVQKFKTALTLAQDHYEASVQGQRIEINVTANVEYSSQVIQGSDWIHPATTKALSTHTEEFDIDPAVEDGERTGKIVFSAGLLTDTVTVHQLQADRLVVSSRNLQVPKVGGAFDITLRTNVEFEVTVPDTVATWVQRVTAPTKAMRTDKVTLQVAENTLLKDRKAMVLFVNKNNPNQKDTLFITQLQTNKLLLLSEAVFMYDRPDTTIALQTNVPYTVMIPSEAADWISLTDDTETDTEHRLKFSLKPNPLLIRRSATVTVRHTQSNLQQQVTFTQAAYAQQPFVQKTVYGYYQEATPVYVYSPGKDQWAFVTRSATTDFRVQSVVDVRLVCIEGLTQNLQEENTVSVTLTACGLTKSLAKEATLLVLRKKEHTLWLMNAATKEGFIIYQ